MKYYVYCNGVWGGFVSGDEGINVFPLESILKNTKFSNYEITNDFNKANILIETHFKMDFSLFGTSAFPLKKWDFTIFFSGESVLFWNREKEIANYNFDVILRAEQSHNNIIDFPYFVWYTYSHGLYNSLINIPIKRKIPPKFCCFMVSNHKQPIRNKMFEMLSNYKKVDSYGKYMNNTGVYLNCTYYSPEFRDVISNYKFIICFENEKCGTYSTEKIVNAYLAGSIPIYWSSHSIFNVFNRNSMLFLEDENYESYINLIRQIVYLDNNDDAYLKMANEPAILKEGIDYWENNYSIDALSKQVNNKII